MRGTQFAQLTAFVAVAETRSFTKAATHLGTGTSSLSQAVRSLEEDFGVRLLDRTTRSVSLTEAGADLLNHLNPVLEGVSRAIDAVDKFRDRPAGTLRLSVHPLVALTVIGPMMARFSRAFPEINLEISVDIERKDIVGDGFDAGIHLSGSIAQDMIAVPIAGKFRLITVASPDYLDRNGTPSMPSDLSHHKCVRSRLDPVGRDELWRFTRAGQSAEVSIEDSLAVNDPMLALQAALDGLGIVQLPHVWVAPLVAAGKLIAILEDWASPFGEFCLFYSSRRHVPVKLRVLMDFLRKEAREAMGFAGPNRPHPALAQIAASASGGDDALPARGATKIKAHLRRTGEIIPIGGRPASGRRLAAASGR